MQKLKNFCKKVKIFMLGKEANFQENDLFHQGTTD